MSQRRNYTGLWFSRKGRVPQVRQSVPGPKMIGFECFQLIAQLSLLSHTRKAIVGLRPSCSAQVR
jgi:hypothetical protein